MSDYPDPVSRLITYGDCRNLERTALQNEWPDYLSELKIVQEHIPDLIRLVQDDRFDEYMSDNVAVWTPMHAWRVLGQLRSSESISVLIKLLEKDDDWVGEEIPQALAMIGPEAILPLNTYLSDSSNELYPRINAATALEEIGKCHPIVLDEVISILSEELSRYSENDSTLNAFIILCLKNLAAVSEIDLIRDAFNQQAVDISILGDLEDVEIKMGVRSKRQTPAPDYIDPKMRVAVDKLMNTLDSAGEASFNHGKKDKIGRNDPCPCGSGKKFKKCCLN
jgi:hypothetical protein